MDGNNTNSYSGSISINDILSKAVKNITTSAANADGISGIPTGYNKLDDITSGFQNGELITIAGRPAMGKTSFALSIAKNVAIDYEIPTLFFSLEMNAKTIVNRLISNVCEIPTNKILNGQLMPDEWERLDKRIELLTDKPLFIDDTPGLNIEGISNRIKNCVEENGIKLVIIDYFQLIATPYRSNRTRHDELAEIMHALKILARELNIPIIILSQLNRAVEDREYGLEGKRPILSDLRECGAIEEDSDIVLFVHRPEYYHIYQDDNGKDLHGLAQIIIAKHRMGYTGDVLLAFRGEYVRFENPELFSLRPSSQGEIERGETPLPF